MIAEREFLDKVEEYRVFLDPFLKKDNVVFCEWFPTHTRFADILPALPSLIGRRQEWRAVIVCNENGIEKKNPFDFTSDYAPQRFDGVLPGDRLDEQDHRDFQEYIEEEHRKKLRAYDAAVANPLTRLCTFLCDPPTLTRHSEALAEEDPDYARYLIEAEKKQELRRHILGEEILEISKPSEVLCIAKRTCEDTVDALEDAWSIHTEMEYSRFYDRNMYFEKMRFLLFDVMARTQRNYAFDYLRFLYATVLLASNDTPTGCFAPNRVYRLLCDTDEAPLRNMLYIYETKLTNTRALIEQRMQYVSEQKPARLSDREAEMIFCAKVSIPVTVVSEFDRDDLYVDTVGVGLSNGCPTEETAVWEDRYAGSKKALAQHLKQARRAVKRAAVDARTEDGVQLSRIGALNEFQVEDVLEHIAREEAAMIDTYTPDLHDDEQFLDRMQVEDKAVRNKIRKRMTRNTTLILGALGVLAYILGFFTLFYMNSSSNAFNFMFSLTVVGVAAAAIAAVAFVTLGFLRGALVKLFKRFNRTMHGIGNDIDDSMAQYSQYLSHMCNVRRGFAVVNAVKQHHDPVKDQMSIYRKHMIDIETVRATLRETFGHFMVDPPTVALDNIHEYDFNFDLPTSYLYTAPYTEGKARTIEFLQAGVTAEIPVDFVKSITARREELYE